MNMQKMRKTEYKREHFAILRRKRGGEWIVRSYRSNALGMLHAKEAKEKHWIKPSQWNVRFCRLRMKTNLIVLSGEIMRYMSII